MFTSIDGFAAILPTVAKAPRNDTPVKTTVELPVDIWRAAKIRAMDNRVDLRTVFIEALEAYLGVRARPEGKAKKP